MGCTNRCESIKEIAVEKLKRKIADGGTHGKAK
jgi:hypothetical protein